MNSSFLPQAIMAIQKMKGSREETIETSPISSTAKIS